MSRSRSMTPFKLPAAIAVLFSAMLMALPLPVYGQQEVDPTWYNPWPAANTAMVHSRPQVAIRRDQPVRPVSTVQVTRKLRGKRPSTQSAVVMAHFTK